MGNGDDLARFVKLPTRRQNLWLFEELQGLKKDFLVLIDTARDNGKWMKRIGIGIFLAVLSAAIGVWVKG